MVMARGSAIALPNIFKARDSSFYSSTLQSDPDWPWSPAKARCKAFFLRTPWRASLLANRDNCSCTGGGVCMHMCMWEWVFFHLCIFLFKPRFLFLLLVYLTKMHWVPTVSCSQWWRLRVWIWYGSFMERMAQPAQSCVGHSFVNLIEKNLRHCLTGLLCCCRGMSTSRVIKCLAETIWWLLAEQKWKLSLQSINQLVSF